MRRAGEEAGASIAEDWLHRAIEASGDVFYDWDLRTDRIAWAGRGAALFGTGQFDGLATGDGFTARISPEDLPGRVKALREHIESGVSYDCEYRLRGEAGAFVWVHDRGAVTVGPDGQPVRLIGSLRPITARKQNEARLERLANFDELSGQFNKLRLREAVEHALAVGNRYGARGAFLAVGVDKLALINAAYGHAAGDAVLVALSQRLDRLLRASDVIGRLDSDLFGILLGRSSGEQMLRAAERILKAAREQPVVFGEARIHVTVSIGGVLFPEHPTTPYDLMARAEAALRQAKRDGCNCFVAYRGLGEDSDIHRRTLETGATVEAALKEGRLLFAYQPIVRARSREGAFHECLLRLRTPEGEILPAGAFVPAIEQLGLVRLVDRHVLDLAIAQLEAAPACRLAVNVSGFTAADHAWLRALRAQLKGRPQIAERLVIEVTETAALSDVEMTARFVTALRDLGCRIAIDDFGAGFTSFKHLRALPVHIVKIDGSFVRNLSGNVDNQLFIRNLLGLAEAFGLETVAECVESEADAALLVGEGVDYLQGYHFGRPSLELPWASPAEKARRPDLPRLYAAV